MIIIFEHWTSNENILTLKITVSLIAFRKQEFIEQPHEVKGHQYYRWGGGSRAIIRIIGEYRLLSATKTAWVYSKIMFGLISLRSLLLPWKRDESISRDPERFLQIYIHTYWYHHHQSWTHDPCCACARGITKAQAPSNLFPVLKTILPPPPTKKEQRSQEGKTDQRSTSPNHIHKGHDFSLIRSEMLSGCLCV